MRGMQPCFVVAVLLLAMPIRAIAEAIPPVVSPETRTVVSPPPVAVPQFELDVTPGGGLAVRVKGQLYCVESSYSYPHGGENSLVADPKVANGEPEWQMKTEKVDDNTYRVTARGRYYAIDRRVEMGTTRILVKDTIRNTSDDVLGIILSNHLNTRGDLGNLKPTMMNKLTAFVHAADSGVGIIALDDLYQIQEKNQFANGLASLKTSCFGLDKGASYTIEWAVYPTATADYYDFINQVRKDEGLNRRVEGALAFVPRRKPPTAEFVDLFNMKYGNMDCLGQPPDDPAVSLEGVEFPNYPKECELLKQTIAETKRLYPDVKIMFHVAHGLYACADPKRLFPDSVVLRADGKSIKYNGDNEEYYRPYFSRERWNEGWRWHIVYPTMGNSFGKAMIKAVRYMVDELGATGMWADGFLSGYAYVDGNDGGYSYDRWDGHSVDIDLATKLVTRKKTCVAWAALPVLKEVIRIIDAKGGVVITNEGPGYPASRSLWRENLITSCEGSPASVVGLHLGRAPCSLNSVNASAEADYRDILTKLENGSLYFWMYPKMDHKTLVEHMYSMTIESIHRGCVRGKERIVTKNSGVYGWPGDRQLHVVYRYDARGYLAPNDCLSTVAPSGVHTEVLLEKDESAAVVKIPITIQSAEPINFRVCRYDAGGIEVAVHGRDRVEIEVRSGEFALKPGDAYRVTAATPQTIVADQKATLAFPLTLAGTTTLKIEPATGPKNP